MLIRRAAPRTCTAAAGFTLIELMVTISLMSLLLALAMPSMSSWMRNNRIRTVSDSLQNGIRSAQSEATRRSRQVVFSLTADKPVGTGYTASPNGGNWAINTVPAMTAGESTEFIEAGVLADAGSGVELSGPAAICFNAIGRLVANLSPGVPGATCTLPPAPATAGPSVQAYDVTIANAERGVDRPLRVLVALGGQVRLCDPAKVLSSTSPDGCP